MDTSCVTCGGTQIARDGGTIHVVPGVAMRSTPRDA
jgi:hypothetical protein